MKEESKNSDFVMVYRKHIDDLTELARSNGGAYDFLMFLIKNMDSGNALCVSMQVLTEIMGLSRVSLSKRVKYLKDNGWIEVLKTGTSNVYIVNPEVVWTSYANQKDYCKFKANILLSSSENAEYLKNRESSVRYKTINKDFIEHVRANKELYEANNHQPQPTGTES